MRHKKIISGSLMLLITASLTSLFFLSFSSNPARQLTILSGSNEATQYRFVQDIATIVGPSLDFKIQNMETKGDAYNFSQVSDPKTPYKLAVMQADYLYYMQAQDMRLKTEKTKNLKVVLPLCDEQIHLVTKASRGYKGLQDMNGQVVSIGSEEQGTFCTATLIKERSKVNWTSRNINFEDCLGALNTNKIHAFFIVSSAPIKQLDLNPQSMVDKLALVPLANFNDWASYYKPDTIRKTEYKWLDQDIPTFSVPAVLVVNESKLSEQERTDVMNLRSAIQSKFEELKANGHPKWKQVNLTGWKDSDWPYFK